MNIKDYFDYIAAFFNLAPIQFILLTSGVVMAGFLVIAFLAIMGKKTRLFDFITLKAEITGTAGGADPDENAPEDYAALIGKSGVAVSTLRPVGKAKIDDKVYPVETEGEYLEKDEKIKVVNVFGNRIIVDRK